MKYTFYLLSLVFAFAAAPVFAQETAAQSTAAKKPTEAQRLEKLIAPWVGENTVGVGHINLNTLGVRQMYDDTLTTWKRFLKRALTEENEVLDFARQVESYVDSLEAEFAKVRAAGTGDVFVLVDMKLGPQVPLLIIPVDAKKKAAVDAVMNIPKDAAWLPEDMRQAFQRHVVLRQEGNYILVAFASDKEDAEIKAEVLENARKTIVAARRVELAAGLKLTAKYPLKALFLPNDELREMVPGLVELAKENLPDNDVLPPDFELPSAEALQRMVRVSAIGADPRQDRYASFILSTDEKAAGEFLAFTKRTQQAVIAKMEAELKEKSPLEAAVAADMMEWYYNAFMPKQKGNVLFWDSEIVAKEYEGDVASIKMIAISGLATALALPAVQQARSVARQVQAQNNMKQLMFAMLAYETVHGKLPPAYTVDKNGKPLHSWRVLMLPYLEQESLYEAIRHDEPWDSEWNSQFHHVMPVVYCSPAATNEPGMATVAVVVGEETMFPPGGKSVKFHECKDGVSNTVALVERNPVCWMDPAGDVLYEDAKKGIFRGGQDGITAFTSASIIAMGDGAVRAVDPDIDLVIFQAILTKAGRERVNVNGAF